MSTIVTRSGKGSPLTNTEVDTNFTNLNSDKLEKSGGTMTGDLTLSGTSTKINFPAQTTDEAKIYTDINGSVTDLVLEVDDDEQQDRIILRHSHYTFSPLALDMARFERKNATEATVLLNGDVTVSGNLAPSGTVDGRDIASDGTKIDAAYGWGDHASAGYQDGSYVDGIAYENNASLSRSVGDGQQWVKICDTASGQPQRIYLKVTHTGDNTNCEFEAEISTSGYSLPDHILVKNHQKYNNPKVTAIRTHEASSADMEVWVQVEDLTSSNGSLIVRSNKAIPTLTATSTEPTWANSKVVYTNSASTNYQIIPSSGIMFQDNVNATFGTGEDLKIYHDGTNSWINDVGTGDLILRGNNVRLMSAALEYYLYASADGAVSLYHNNAGKLATSSSGVTVTGGVTTTGAALLSSYRSSWTNAPNHDVLHTGWNSSIDDYIFLKAAGNGTASHGQLIVADNGVYFGRTNSETGTAVVDSATDPFDNATWGYINSSGVISKNDLIVEGGEISMGPTTDSNRLRLIEDTQQTNEVLKIQNDTGHCTIGPQNSGYNHFVTDRSANYFNTEIQIGTGVIRSYDGDFNLNRAGSSTARIRITDGETHSDQNFTVSGLLSATTKSFVIDHPIKDGFKLRHGSLEGPENGVYVRGRTRENIIELPDYWKGLVDEESITVSITPVGRDQGIYVESWDNQRVVLAGTAIDCFYTIYGERKDVDPFEVEYEE